MEYNLWVFLTFATIFGIIFLISLIYMLQQQKMKMLEIEELKIQKTNLRNEVDDAVTRKLGDAVKRIEILESIITDKKYVLNEKIANLK